MTNAITISNDHGHIAVKGGETPQGTPSITLAYSLLGVFYSNWI